MATSTEPMRGKFIVFEGLDGADIFGQVTGLAQWLNKEKGLKQVHFTREPSDGPIGMNIRMHLEGRLDIDKLSMATFFAADRMDHLYREETGIVGRLNNGEYVLCDRYYLSSLAYQTLEPEIDMEYVASLNAKCIPPDLTLFIDLPVDVCMQRIVSEPLLGIHLAIFEMTEENIKALKTRLDQARNSYLQAIEFLKGRGEQIEIVKEDTPGGIEREIRRIVTRTFRL